MIMETIKFKGRIFKQAPDSVYEGADNVYDICDKTQLGEFFSYRNGIVVLHTTKGFIASYMDDFSNYWTI